MTERQQEIFDAYEGGKSVLEISRERGISRQYIDRVLRKNKNLRRLRYRHDVNRASRRFALAKPKKK